MTGSKDVIPVMKEKTYIFWIVILFMYIVSIANTIILLSMLHIIKYGNDPKVINVLTTDGSIQFSGESGFEIVYKEDGILRGFKDEPVQINITDSILIINIRDEYNVSYKKLEISSENITFYGLKNFDVIDENDKTIFNLNVTTITLPLNLSTLNVEQLKTSGIVSPSDKSLHLKSDKVTRIQGSEGIHLNGQNISLIADGDVYFNSLDGNMHILTKDFLLDPKYLPTVSINSNDSLLPVLQRKLCICMPSGSLFAVNITKNLKSHLACSYIDVNGPDSPCFH